MTTPVSGPGQFSKRTDKAVGEANRSLPDAGYGEQAAYQEQLQAAPLGEDVSGMDFNSLFGNAASNVVPFGAESTMPDVPVTDGADAGPGAGTEVLSSTDSSEAAYLSAYLPALEFMANTGASDMARNLVRKIKYSM